MSEDCGCWECRRRDLGQGEVIARPVLSRENQRSLGGWIDDFGVYSRISWPEILSREEAEKKHPEMEIAPRPMLDNGAKIGGYNPLRWAEIQAEVLDDYPEPDDDPEGD
jgi:hypothetical protein